MFEKLNAGLKQQVAQIIVTDKARDFNLSELEKKSNFCILCVFIFILISGTVFGLK